MSASARHRKPAAAFARYRESAVAPVRHRPWRAAAALLLALLLALPLATGGCAVRGDAPQPLTPPQPPASSASAAASANAQSASETVRQIGQELFNYEVSLDTLTLNQLVADPAALGITAPKASLGEFTVSSYREDNTWYHELLVRLDALDRSELSESDALTAELIEKVLEQTLQSEAFFYYNEPLFPSMGIHSNLPNALLEYSFRNRHDIDDYLGLLNDIPRYFNQVIAFERVKAKRGLLMNQACFDDILKEIDTFLVEPADNVLIKSFNLLLDSGKTPFAELGDDERASLRQANSEAVHNAVYPAWQKLRAAVAALKPLARSETKIVSYARGREYYALDLHIMGFSQTPEQAAELLDERLGDFLDALLDSGVLPDEGGKPNIPGLSTPFPAKPTLEYLRQAMLADFPEIADFNFSVEETPEELPNDLALAYYKIPAVDDPDDNQIYYYPQNVSDDLSYLTTLAHEGFPGHMYQTNYFAQCDPQPVRKLLRFDAYMEGYAMYAETLALSYFGLNEQQAASQAAYDALMYALHARIDIGVNYQGWSQQQLAAYLEDFGMSSAAGELYLGAQKQPQVYLPYGLGLVSFLDLRAETEQRLGSSFVEKDYHDAILKDGALPLDMLARQVERWTR
ncbi:MAG: DUF885 domain-containing protein [Coriobacteriales bacterium]|jgi:uncharacterized protein (DUF885 family)|nr:DUF885 domain-containing protein [Coriobacteriales bacterium]